MQQSWQLDGADSRCDIYVLPPLPTRQLVKLREGRHLEIKQRIGTRHGLQQWRVAMVAEFPLRPIEIRALALSLGLTTPPPAAARLAAPNLLAALSEQAPDIRLRLADKARLRFKRRGTLAEIVHVNLAGDSLFSIAVEDTRPDILRHAVDELALSAYPNRDYGAQLSQIGQRLSLSDQSVATAF
ncbi:MAG: hypothetical protein Tsb0016_02440 [Sphingomonadales bacterium]